jgi:hypothetical protein
MGTMQKDRAMWTGIGMAIKATYGAGAAAAASITITGIKLGDEIIAAFEVQPPTAGSGNFFKTNLLAECSIYAADTVRNTSTNTTGNQVFVIWATRRV